MTCGNPLSAIACGFFWIVNTILSVTAVQPGWVPVMVKVTEVADGLGV